MHSSKTKMNILFDFIPGGLTAELGCKKSIFERSSSGIINSRDRANCLPPWNCADSPLVG